MDTTVVAADHLAQQSGGQPVLAEGTAGLSDAGLIGAIREREQVSRNAITEQLDMIAEVERRGLHSALGARSMHAWVRETLNLAEDEAKSRVLVARETTETRSSHESRPELPATAEALGSGDVTIDHGRVIVDGIAKLPPSVGPEQRTEVDALLAEQARVLSPRQLRTLAAHLRYELDQDGALADEQHQLDHREFHLITAEDGSTVVRGRLDRETGAKFRAALEPLAAPSPQAEGVRDPRSWARRNADALETLLDAALSQERAAGSGPGRPQLTITIDHDDLRRRLPGEPSPNGGALEPTGQPITASNARRIACDADVLPLVLGGDSQPLDVGRTRRTAPPHLRSALLVRDGRCASPRCDDPPGVPEAHHIRHWADGGATSLDNAVMLCAHHHRVVHRHGWVIEIDGGHVAFTPPAQLDPRRRPRTGNSPPRRFRRSGG